MELNSFVEGAKQLPCGRSLSKACAAVQANTEGAATIKHLFQFFSCCPEFCSLYSQLLWELGARLQHKWLASFRGKQVAGMQCRVVNIEDALEKPHQLDRELVRYMCISKRCLGQDLHLSCATDKSVVGGLPLQNTIFCIPENYAVVAAPQVPRSRQGWDFLFTDITQCMVDFCRGERISLILKLEIDWVRWRLFVSFFVKLRSIL